MSDPNVAHLASICCIPHGQAAELLLATGSVERAVSLHLSRTHQDEQHVDQSEPLARPNCTTPPGHEIASKPGTTARKQLPSKRKQLPSQRSPITTSGAQRTIDDFFSSPSKPFAKQRRINDYFAPSTLANDSQAQPAMPPTGPADNPRDLDFREVVDSNNTSVVAQAVAVDASLSELKNSLRNVAASREDDPACNALHDTNLQDSGLCYDLLAKTFATMIATTKRNAKLLALQNMFTQVIHAVGGIRMPDQHNDRQHAARVLTCTLDLVLGKLSLLPQQSASSSPPLDNNNSNNNNAFSYRTAPPLQVSGAAVSQAIQTVTGTSRAQLSQAYRRTGDLGDVAAERFVGKSMQSFFAAAAAASDELTTKRPVLTIVRAHELVSNISTVSGKGSQTMRQQLLVKLLRAASHADELRFLVRTLINNMRLGATVKSVLAGLAFAVHQMQNPDDHLTLQDVKKRQSLVDDLQKVFNVCPRLDEISLALLQGGIKFAQKQCSLSVCYPIQPMLANPAHSLEEVDKFMLNGKEGYFDAVAEWKYDGVRCQAHWDGKSTRLYSRHLLNCSESYPDATQYMLSAKKQDVVSYILDAEIVGVMATEDGFRLLPFQDLSTRRGTKSVDAANKVRIRVYVFDLLYINGVSLLSRPLFERQAALQEHFTESAGFAYATSFALPKFDESLLQSTLQAAVEGGAEGLMIKLTGQNVSPSEERTFGYEAGFRSQLWLKLKRDYVAGFADTIDVVPIGAWFGNGRKAEKGFLSPILLAVYDDEEGAFRSISRCMSFTDAMYEAIREFYFHGVPYPEGVGLSGTDEAVDVEGAPPKVSNGGASDRIDEGSSSSEGEAAIVSSDPIAVHQDRVNCFSQRPSPSYIITNESPSIWFKPMEVFEVSFADLSLSRAHTAASGIVDDPSGRGVALFARQRFPRFKRRRPDKAVEQATTTEQIAQFYSRQTKMRNN